MLKRIALCCTPDLATPHNKKTSTNVDGYIQSHSKAFNSCGVAGFFNFKKRGKLIMEIRTNVNFTVIDSMNTLTSAEDIKNKVDSEIKVIGIMVYDTVDKSTGEVKTVGAIKADDGTIYGFTSATMIECAEMMAGAFTDSNAKSITVIPFTKQSNNKRTFYQFKIVDIEK